jgi:hypothetical protein
MEDGFGLVKAHRGKEMIALTDIEADVDLEQIDTGSGEIVRPDLIGNLIFVRGRIGQRGGH